jgi:DMSO/TMAO reductase YedYZ molybdopterin-dependent catalytic subunit
VDLLARLDKDHRLIPYGGANFGMPLDLIEPEAPLIVPNDRFFVRSNGPIPTIDPDAWRLRLDGLVERSIALSLADLRTLPQRTLTAFIECAGNGRTRFNPIPDGTPWKNDAAGNAKWTGVPLAAVLDHAGVRAGAVDVVAQGGDFEGMRRGLPLAVARDPDTLLVWAMNGADLPLAHGGPVRLLVPGWAGIASTKWLVGLDVLDHAYDGFWNADNYVFWTGAGEPVRPIEEMPVKSVISTPADGARLRAGPRLVAGYAWSGYGAVRRVEVSTDGGETWHEAGLRTAGRRSWVRFEYEWHAAPGEAHLRARATDERGLTQPAAPAWNAKGYQMNAIHAVTVSVEP